MSIKGLWHVVIVGRANVGKSTLFNRLSTDVRSITYDEPGVTRDFISDIVSWQGKRFNLIDTGGVSLRKVADEIEEKTRSRALALIESSQVILFVCDGQVGMLNEDREIARLLHHHGKKVIVVVNKTDIKMVQEHLHEFERLGFPTIVPVSAQHGIGIGDLLESIVSVLPDTPQVEEPDLQCKVVILGKPNVGKSSLMNLILKQDRVIVADMPGTTREAVTDTVSFYQQDIQLTDTPGIRKKRAVDEPLEQLMVKSALHAVDQADIVLLMIDKTEGEIADQVLKLAFYAFEQKHKGLILLFNKSDIVETYENEQLLSSLDRYKHLTDKIELLTISCKTQNNVGKVLPLVQKVCDRYRQRFGNDELTLLLHEAMYARPLYKGGRRLIVHSARQIHTGPITILLTVNESKLFGESQRTFFERVLRRKYDLKGVPVKFAVRQKAEVID